MSRLHILNPTMCPQGKMNKRTAHFKVLTLLKRKSWCYKIGVFFYIYIYIYVYVYAHTFMYM